MNDIRYALRALRKTPGFTLVALLALALGIGANTAIFSVVYAVLLKPLPYAAGDRLYQLSEQNPSGKLNGATFADFATWRERSKSFEMLSISAYRSVTMTAPGTPPENIFSRVVSNDLFPLLGVQPLLGRWFREDEFRTGAPGAAILSYRLWQRSFAGDPNVVGRELTLNGRGATVVGVMPPDFIYPHPAFEMWMPWQITADNLANRVSFNIPVIARLKPGASLREATAEMNGIAASLAQQFPNTHREVRTTIDPLKEKIVGTQRVALLVLLAAAGFVLLIACANVANLLLARAATRRGEIAIRAALGAGRWRIVRQLLTESMLLALGGCAAGVMLALWGSTALIATFPKGLYVPRLDQTAIDAPVLAFALTAALLTGILFGIAPAWHASRVELNRFLGESGRSNAGQRSNWMRGALVVVEIAFSLVLLIGAGLMLRSFARLVDVQPGFHPEHVLTVKTPAPGFAEGDRAKQAQRYRQMMSEIGALPGVESVGIVSALPLGNVMEAGTFYIEGAVTETQRVPFHSVGGDYFAAMGIPVVRGRAFTDADAGEAPPVAIVNETLARQYWPSENPIGKRITMANPRSGPWATIVGIVADVKYQAVADPPAPELYRPFAQFVRPDSASLVIRTKDDPVALAASVRERIRASQPMQPIGDITTMSQVVADSVARPRFYAALIAIFAVLALALAAAGVYGVMAYLVTQRMHELGVRVALGASPREIVQLVIGQGATLALIGIACGLAGAWGLTRYLTSELYGVTSTDPVTFTAVSALLLAVALAANYIPARRAARLDPMETLRNE